MNAAPHNAALRPVYVCAAAAVSSAGFAWRELARHLDKAEEGHFAPARQLAAFGAHAPQACAEVAAIPSEIDVPARARKFMSHPARLAVVASQLLLKEKTWCPTPEILQDTAFYLGVGASGADMQELEAMLAASMHEQAFSLAEFGKQGLAACNPLFAFQLMNNFTLCHAAIVHGIGGPNSAFFSRGTGTVAALQEAQWQVASGISDYAIAGAADSALHPVTWAQLAQLDTAQQIIPAEAAALLALSANQTQALAQLGTVQYLSDWQQMSSLLKHLRQTHEHDLLLIAPCNAFQRARLQAALVGFRLPICDISQRLGESLAATPAMAWLTALAHLQENNAAQARVFILSAGLDDGLGLVEIRGLACNRR